MRMLLKLRRGPCYDSRMSKDPHLNTAIRVAVADKSPLIQAALKQLLTEDPRFKLCMACTDGDAFLEAITHTQVDVGVIGWVIPPGSGKYVLDQLATHARSPRIVVYSGAEGTLAPSQAMAHGAAAFVSKSEQIQTLLDTIAAVAQGKMIFPFLDIKKLNQNPLALLTRRELEVLSALAAGQTNKQIAILEGVSTNTIKYHIKNIYDKLDVHNRGQAVAVYFRS